MNLPYAAHLHLPHYLAHGWPGRSDSSARVCVCVCVCACVCVCVCVCVRAERSPGRWIERGPGSAGGALTWLVRFRRTSLLVSFLPFQEKRRRRPHFTDCKLSHGSCILSVCRWIGVWGVDRQVTNAHSLSHRCTELA